jgi:3-dehydrosphinganine reductase
MDRSDPYAGRRALVTGGSSGIGAATARALLRRGAHVAIAARRPGPLADTLRRLRAETREGVVVEAVQLDVTDPGAVETGVARAVGALGGLDLLVNNAGVAHAARFEDTTPETFEHLMATNFLGVVHVTRAALPRLCEQGRGDVVNVSSLAGLIGIYGYTAYAASKFAVTGFSQALRQELRPHGIGVSLVCPPDTDTPQLAEENRTKPPETRAIAGTTRVLAPEVVAEALLRGVARGRFLIVPGFEARWAERLARHFPRLGRWVMDQPLARHAAPQKW